MDRLEKRLLAEVARASHDFQLIEPGDRVLVAVSGGKDSHALLYLLRQIQRRAPFEFSLIAVNVDQGHPGFPEQVLPQYFEREGYEYKIIKEDTYSIVKEKIPEGKTFCSLCSRLRRGILYTVAVELGATKIALGHHRDDVIETLLLQENLQRKQIKNLLNELDAKNPLVRKNVFAALGNVRLSHLYDVALRAQVGIVDAREPGEEGAALAARAPEVPLSALLRAR
jgi:tRNA 2-thiocytidine biosynthesis protein TtcA